MNQKIFTIFDSKAKAYLTPFFLHEDGMALRIFGDCVNDITHQFGKHPEDYTLFSIGSWSDEKAKFLTTNPISLAIGVELIQDSPNWFDKEQQKQDLEGLQGSDQLKEVK